MALVALHRRRRPRPEPCTLTLLDGKQVELAPWSGSAEHFVGPDMAGAIEVLKDLCAEMDRRYSVLLASGLRKIERDGDFGLHVVAIDELAFYMRGGTKDERTELSETLRDLISRGRAAGMIVIAATQKPSNDIVPTFVRDLFSFRMALRCTTPEASDTILGQGWAKEGYSASTLDPTTPRRGLAAGRRGGAGQDPHPLPRRRRHRRAGRQRESLDGGRLVSVGRPLARACWPRSTRPACARTRSACAGSPWTARRASCAEGDLLVACKDRRAAVCPSCSRLYQADAWQLVAAGIRGGKGVDARRRRPPAALRHPDRPVVRAGAPPGCCPRRSVSPAGRGAARDLPARALAARARGATARADRWSASRCASSASTTRGAVLWNAHVPRLWARTVAPPLPRGGRRAGQMSDELRPVGLRLSYIKVVEFQRRGLVHLHVVLRADGGGRPGRAASALARRRGARRRRCARPSAEVGRGRAATSRARTLRPGPLGRPARRPRASPPTTTTDATAIAAYVAKYATKTADGTAWLAHRIRSVAQIERLGLRPHIVALVAHGLGRSGARPELRAPAPPRPRPHPRLRRPVLLQEPALLDHLRGAARGPGRLRPRRGRGRHRLRRRVALRRPGLRAPRRGGRSPRP